MGSYLSQGYLRVSEYNKPDWNSFLAIIHYTKTHIHVSGDLKRVGEWHIKRGLVLKVYVTLYAPVAHAILSLAFGHFTVFCIFYIALCKVKTRLGNSQLQLVGMTAKVKFVICLCNQFPVPACQDSVLGLFILFHSADIRRKNGVRRILVLFIVSSCVVRASISLYLSLVRRCHTLH